MKLFLTSSSLVCTLLIIFNNFSGLCVADDSELHVTTEDSVISDGHQPTIITVELLTIEEITKLPVWFLQVTFEIQHSKFLKQGKELQRRLKKKGVTCKGCSEKIDFISKVFESQELEDVVEPPPAPPIVKEGEGLDKAKIDEVQIVIRSVVFEDYYNYTSSVDGGPAAPRLCQRRGQDLPRERLRQPVARGHPVQGKSFYHMKVNRCEVIRCIVDEQRWQAPSL